MTAATTDQTSPVTAWRQEQLEIAGYPPDIAAMLAVMPGVDLHLACDLAQRGCPPRVAVEILL